MDEIQIPPIITLIIHPIDVDAHPTWGAGYRWAVHVGRPHPAAVEQCANAGRAPDRQTALTLGDTCAATAVQAARLFGVQAQYGRMDLDYDPIPAGEERIKTL